MSDENAELPAAIRELLHARVHTIEELEALLLLHRERGRAFLAGEVAAELRIPPDIARTALEELVHSEIVNASSATPLVFNYAPRDPKVAKLVDELATSYPSHRVEVLVLISKSAMNRVRKSALRTFSEAFRLRGPKKNG